MSSTSRGTFDLSDKKRALLEALLSEQGINSPGAERIPRREEGGPAPLSFAQQRLWFFDQFEPGNPAYNLLSTVLLQGKLETVALERSFSEVIRRHKALRTMFDVKDGEPVQIIAPPKPLHLNVIDISHLCEAEHDGVVQNLIHQQTQTSFNLKRGPLLRITLVRLRDEEHVLLLAMHHIVSDAWSMGVLISEVVELYQAYVAGREVALAALPIQYADFAIWQREWLQGEVLEEQFAYWRRQLGGSLPILELPTDRPRPLLQTYNGSSLSFPLLPVAVAVTRIALQSGRRDALYDVARGLQGLSVSLHGTGRLDRRFADCQSPPSRVGKSDRLFRQHAGDAYRPVR